MMKTLEIPDVKLFSHQKFEDERGYFYENFNKKIFSEELGYEINFVQDNLSVSKKNVIRGLHLQVPPKAQPKLVSVLQGKIFDVAVDMRPESSTYKKNISIILSGGSAQKLFIPEGFAHGFQVLSDIAIVTYKTSEYYSVKHERSIIWNDENLNIHWPSQDVILSDKDKSAQTLDNFIKENSSDII